MSLFQSLFPLAQRTTLTVLITAEGDQLRVNVTPRLNDDKKGEKPLYPLSLLAAPAELDADFAEAVAIYEPSCASVLDQARAATAANGGKSTKATALPAPTDGAKRGRGRPPKNSEPPENAPGAPTADTPPENDPRQMSIEDAAAAGEAAAEAGNDAAAPASASDAPATSASIVEASADAGTETDDGAGDGDGVDAW